MADTLREGTPRGNTKPQPPQERTPTQHQPTCTPGLRKSQNTRNLHADRSLPPQSAHRHQDVMWTIPGLSHSPMHSSWMGHPAQRNHKCTALNSCEKGYQVFFLSESQLSGYMFAEPTVAFITIKTSNSFFETYKGCLVVLFLAVKLPQFISEVGYILNSKERCPYSWRLSLVAMF